MLRELNESLDDLCVNLEIAQSQRDSELRAYLGKAGTMGFEIMGCYTCNGYKTDCKAYLPMKEAKKC
jgi:hypothetical protein